MNRILFQNADILTMDDENRFLSSSNLIVKDGQIESVGLPPSGTFTRIIDASHFLLMPGLVNAHTHTPMTLLRGLKDDCTLDEWLNDYIWPAENTLTREDYYVGALLGIAEALATGTTSITDMYRNSTELALAAATTGIKANVCESITAGEDYNRNTHSGIAECIRVWEDFNNYDQGRIRCDTSIQSLWQTPKELWKDIRDLAFEKDMGIHIHCAETKSEMEHCLSKYGSTPVKLLQDAEVLKNHTVLVHGIYLSEEEWKIVQKNHACIVHDPCSNLKCCSGFANLKPYIDHGISVALGTDGVCSNNSGDMFDTIKLTGLVQKMLNNDPCFLPAEQLLKMAIQEGLHSQKRDNEAGALIAGMDADLIAIDKDFPSMQPMLSAPANLAYSASGAMVRMTMVRGKILYENGEFTTIDIERLKNSVKKIISRF